MADSTAMTVDFLRARLLSERSVSRAAKERADELAKRVAELEEQVRAVTAQRRQAEWAAAEVLAVLESQGFGDHLSDGADDSDGSEVQDGEEEDGKSRGDTAGAAGEDGEGEPSAAKGEAEDALSGTTAQPGGLSWKGRSVSPRKARQLKQRHRRSFFYLLSSADPSPKYRVGQSCRKNKRRMELSNVSRSVATEEDGEGGGSQRGRQDGPDFTDDGEVGVDERSPGAGGGVGQYVIRYEKDGGEMARVLERQAELIGQYEEEENAQREWEKQYNENRNANKGDVEPKNNAKNVPSTNNPSAERLPNKESSNNSAVPRQDQTSDGDSGYSRDTRSPKRDTTVSAPSDGSPSSDTLNSKASGWSSSRFHDCTDRQLDDTPAPCSIADIESVLQALQRARISLSAKLSKPVPPSQVTLALPAPGDEHREYDDEDLPTDEGSYGDEKLSGSSPSCQEMLALPAPEDYHGHEREGSPLVSHVEKASTSSPPREEMLALPAPRDEYRNRKEAEDYMRIPAGIPGLFRLPVDSFPVDEKMFSGLQSLSRGMPLADEDLFMQRGIDCTVSNMWML
uniref:Uncharacterized protein n=1 Tax=Zea mays TaxID=4577 RepID=A0A804NAP2_MAIZE